MNDQYEAVIGLEVHAQLLTKTKLFCGDSISFGKAPNTNVSAVSLAHPGTLPVMNKEVPELAVKLGLALGCDITTDNFFARKNYFYPDLPKGYQVSQHTAPICTNGTLLIKTAAGERKIRLNRIHMEEDAGKSIHDLFPGKTAIDLNRAGTPLLEIVTEPDMHSAEEACAYLTELRRIVRWLDVCDGNMEEGSLRCDANVSVRLKGETKLGTRVEVKNLNSIRNLGKAVNIEIERLIGICEACEKVIQETRSYDADANITSSMRSKEEAEDYRYFPEPDLPPMHISAEYIDAVKKEMPVMPAVLMKKYSEDYGLSDYDAQSLTADKTDASFYDRLIAAGAEYKSAANWVIGPVKKYCSEKNILLSEFPLNIKLLSKLIRFADEGKVHFNIASTKLLSAMITEPAEPDVLAAKLDLIQENDAGALSGWIDEVMAAMPDKVQEYSSGKRGIISLLAGQVKKLSKGKADMPEVMALLEEKLKK